MTPKRRIFLNIIATYGRSLYALVLGLFTARWALQALGRTDYGLMGLVGGLSGIVSFLNTLMASAVGRFYAVNIGAANKAGNSADGLEECRRWFNTAVAIHTVLPLVLILVGYPCGLWAVENFLTIPADRVDDCIWVWRWTCISCFVAMVNVPFQAMYTAKQEIAELTIYGFVTSTMNALFLYYMISNPDVWLVKFVAWTCLLTITPQVIIGIRAVIKYPECRFRMNYMVCVYRIREICKYAYARFVANLATTMSTQAKAILVNKYMGPDYNASMTVGTSLSYHSMTLSTALSGAMWPAIANKAGEGDAEAVKALSFVVCRIGAVLVLVFGLPLFLEINEVLRLWLKNPPPFAGEVCCAIIITVVLQKMTDGYWMAILGFGEGVVYYSHRSCFGGFILIGLSWLLFALGWGMWSIVIGIVSMGLMLVFVRLYTGRILVNFSPLYWSKSVFLPIFLTSAATCLIGMLPRACMSASLMRVIVTAAICEAVFIPLVWFTVLNEAERVFMTRKCHDFWKKIQCVNK